VNLVGPQYCFRDGDVTIPISRVEGCAQVSVSYVKEDLVSVGPSVVLVDAVEPLRELDEAHVLALDGVQEKAQGLQNGDNDQISENAPEFWFRPHPRKRHKVSDQNVQICVYQLLRLVCLLLSEHSLWTVHEISPIPEPK
jgi:hypothetical protein